MEKTNYVNLDQHAAGFALDCVGSVLSGDSSKQSEYRRIVKRMPAMILQNGLCQALGFLRAKGNENSSFQILYNNISTWLIEEIGIYPLKNDLLSSITKSKHTLYIQAQEESLRVMAWLNRITDAYIVSDEDGE